MESGKLGPMRFGLFAVNMYACADGATAATVARHAEAAGFESLWAGEHVVLPSPRVAPSPMEPQDPALDPLLALTWLAAATTTIRLATGIVILPQRNAVVLAKQVATLDVLSAGRLDLGIGAGYLEPEFRAIGAPFEDRGRATDELVAAMRSLWGDEHPEFHGTHADFAGVDAHPRPMQRAGADGTAGVPIVVGGHSPAAFRRAVSSAQGWYGFALNEAGTQHCLDGLRVAAAQVERPAWLGPLKITVTPAAIIDAASLDRWTALGVDRLVVLPPATADATQLLRIVDHLAPLT